MNYGNYKNVIFWGLCILETQSYSERKKVTFRQHISSKIGTSGTNIPPFLFHLMMSIFHLVSPTFSSNDNWWLIFDDSSTKHCNELNWKSSSFPFFNYHRASLLEFKGDIQHTRVTGRLECRVDRVICPGGWFPVTTPCGSLQMGQTFNILKAWLKQSWQKTWPHLIVWGLTILSRYIGHLWCIFVHP